MESEKFKATLVILTFNEIKGITALYDKLPLDKIDEVFVVDGGSKDGTIEFFKEKGLRVVPQDIHGRGEAFRIGIMKAKNENVVFFSPDGNEDPNDILKLLNGLNERYDMVIASRFMKGSRSDDSDVPFPIRGVGNKVFTLLVNILWSGKLTDSINGFRAIKKSKFKRINPDAPGFAIEFQMSIRALKFGYKIKEIPTYEGDRIGGKSTAHTIPTGWLLTKIILRELMIGKKIPAA